MTIHNNTEESRFEIHLDDGSIALVDYQIAGKNIIYTHTEVPPAHEGKGLGGQLAAYAMQYARDNGYKVQALCPFIHRYVRNHPEYHGITWGF